MVRHIYQGVCTPNSESVKMITAKRILKIYESWLKTVSVFGDHVDIYENPGSSDLAKLNKESRRKLKNFRFIADDKNHKFYLWDANYAVHDEILGALRFKWEDRSHLSLGSCNLIGGRLIIDQSAFTSYKASHYDKSDWIKKYITF